MKGMSEGLKLVIAIVAIVLVVKLFGGASKVAQTVTGAVSKATQGIQFSKVFPPITNGSGGLQSLGLNAGSPAYATADLVYNGGGFNGPPSGPQALADLNSLAITNVLVNPPAA